MKKLTTKTFIEKAKLMHGDYYDYSKSTYVNSKEKVCIICPVHGEFWQNAQTHYTGANCPNCAKNIKIDRSLLRNRFIEKANGVHNSFYNYDKVDYFNSSTKITITCPIHGDFDQIPNDHVSGSNCPSCAKRKKRNDINLSINDVDLNNLILKNPILIPDKSVIIGSIYLFLNPVNGKKYIGKTTSSINSRFSAHFNKSASSDFYFYRAIRKYGWDNFQKYVLFQTEEVDNTPENKEYINNYLSDKEIHFIKLFNSTNKDFGYNLTDGGEGITGCKFTDEVRKKMSENSKGEKNSMFGKTLEKNPRSIPIIQYSLTGEIIKEWSCAIEIREKLGYTASSIRNCYNGVTFKYKGSFWIKKSEANEEKINYYINKNKN